MIGIPTLVEVPPLQDGVRNWEELLWIAMIPADDAALRAAAIALHNKTEEGSCRSLVDDLKQLSSIPAKTPGGLAWKLATVFDFYKPDEAAGEHWTWPAYLLQSALSDALEHERARRMAGGAPTA
jgi:hypothetical protein